MSEKNTRCTGYRGDSSGHQKEKSGEGAEARSQTRREKTECEAHQGNSPGVPWRARDFKSRFESLFFRFESLSDLNRYFSDLNR
jgi:hypothetical protein